MSGIELAPHRAWDDFFPGSDRFGKPDVNDLAKWNNRVVSNLLYYQTNYFELALGVFCIVGFMRPMEMVLGCAVVTVLFVVAVWGSENKAAIQRFKTKAPSVFVMIILLASYCLISMFGGVMVFLLGISLPLLLIFIHASLRLRNIQNKMENRLEEIGLKKTPMGIVLEALGQHEAKINKIADFVTSKIKE